MAIAATATGKGNCEELSLKGLVKAALLEYG